MGETEEVSYGPDHPWHGLARKVCAAILSNQLGLGLDYTLKTHVPEENLGPLWYEAAEYLARTSMESVSEFYGLTEVKPGPLINRGE